jgi:hypothetical protein
MTRSAKPVKSHISQHAIPTSSIITVDIGRSQVLVRSNGGNVVQPYCDDSRFSGLVLPDPEHVRLPAIFLLDSELKLTDSYIPIIDLLAVRAELTSTFRLFTSCFRDSTMVFHLEDDQSVGVQPGDHECTLLPFSPEHTDGRYVLLQNEDHLVVELWQLALQGATLPDPIRNLIIFPKSRVNLGEAVMAQ